jgi:two-component system, NtrC family, response regulator GlrR
VADDDWDHAFTVTSVGKNTVSVPSLEVRVVGPEHGEIVIPLGMSPLVLGTSPECDIVVKDGHVSRQHCEIRLEEGGVVLCDLRSKNGTLVNDLEIHEIKLKPGVTARMGQCRLTLRVTGEPQEVPLSGSASFGAAIGRSLVMRALFARLELAAATDETVLILGESGTGKELLARAIHEASPRRDGPFAVFDCSAVAPTLIESELFGFVKGAFTGAEREREGILEQAHGGTLFLDEIGELPLDLQPKLLRALESRQFRRVGSNTWQGFDARIVAATHRDLAWRTKNGEFRQDLYYRLAVIEARVPPLRDRREDIDLLAERFLANQSPALALHDLPPGSLAMLRGYDWPGNVRELNNTLARLVVFQDVRQLGIDPLANTAELRADPLLALPLREARQQVVEKFEQSYVQAQLRAHRGNVTRAAESVGVSRQFLHRLMDRYRIKSGDVD